MVAKEHKKCNLFCLECFPSILHAHHKFLLLFSEGFLRDASFKKPSLIQADRISFSYELCVDFYCIANVDLLILDFEHLSERNSKSVVTVYN